MEIEGWRELQTCDPDCTLCLSELHKYNSCVSEQVITNRKMMADCIHVFKKYKNARVLRVNTLEESVDGGNKELTLVDVQNIYIYIDLQLSKTKQLRGAHLIHRVHEYQTMSR